MKKLFFLSLCFAFLLGCDDGSKDKEIEKLKAENAELKNIKIQNEKLQNQLTADSLKLDSLIESKNNVINDDIEQTFSSENSSNSENDKKLMPLKYEENKIKYVCGGMKGTCVGGDCQNGEGIFKFEDYKDWGYASYEGEFVDGKMCGEGRMFQDGTEYKGQWKDCKKNGLGTIRFKAGSVFTGEFKDDDIIKGTYTQTANYSQRQKGIFTGDKYVGEFRRGGLAMDGWGIMYYCEGGRYEGEWQRGERHGQGTFYHKSGAIYHSGLWEDDEPVK
tara:strand:+ start:253 stop:1077 length:825 start_codon:yes stop_codon:yes gene_type:complete